MMKKIYKALFVSVFVLGLASCEALDLDLQENPDRLNLSSADVDLVFNTIQFNFLSQMNSLSNTTDQAMRLTGQFGTYTPGQGSMNGVWNNLYNTNTNISALKSFADNEGFTFHLGVAQLIQATLYVNIVDYVGEAVFTEANDPLEFPNPGLDPGVDIYSAMYDLIDEGVANINGPGRPPLTDLYYGGSKAKWLAYANTLKLRMYLQTRLVNPSESTSGINAIISSGTYIDEMSEDLQFQYGSTGGAFESRHPIFTGNYINGAGTFMNNGLMSYMKDSMDAKDPRLTYYFYRQTDRDPTTEGSSGQSLLPCLKNPNAYDFCYVGDYYWGRDHADDEGIPADGDLRTTYGVYPAQGAYDEGQFVAAKNTSATGNGINPLMLSSWVNFMLAESSLTLGTTGSADVYLETGIRQSMAKVASFSPSNMTESQVDDYVAEVMAEYGGANPAGKLDIIIREWYLASFPSGLLPYNNYRRTGYPSFLQAPVISAGAFPRSFFLPSSEINANTNPDFDTQKKITDRVFWDTNPDGFIN